MAFESKWDDPAEVESFARRAPDLRLRALLEDELDPRAIRVLDLGCAGGRNTLLLVKAGCDVEAVDRSPAMVERTRSRLVDSLGGDEAERRVRIGRMDDVSWAAFDLVVALGIYHCAESQLEWAGAIAESARVLRHGGLLLVAVFTPDTDFTDGRLTSVPGESNLFEGFSHGKRAVLVDADELDAAMARHDLSPNVQTVTVKRETKIGQRCTVNALYRKGG